MPVVGDTVAYHRGLPHKRRHPECSFRTWGECDTNWARVVEEENARIDRDADLRRAAERVRQDGAYEAFMASEARRVAAVEGF